MKKFVVTTDKINPYLDHTTTYDKMKQEVMTTYDIKMKGEEAFEFLEEALKDAKSKVAYDGRERYILELKFKVERDTVPIKVTSY